MDHMGDLERRKVMGLLLHGDAAFAGQGPPLPETMRSSGFTGTIEQVARSGLHHQQPNWFHHQPCECKKRPLLHGGAAGMEA